ncbi:MAG: class I SAM-dependent methyltransferase [bacterium]|nr:class I SAM-dependent methyltransferase [bacterium]
MVPDSKSVEGHVEHHYAHGDTLALIIQALNEHGKDLNQLTQEDLAPVDEFHVRGREGTVELAERIEWTPGMNLLDVGCGIGGSSRFLANRYGAKVTGIDLTHEYVEVATNLTKMVRMEEGIDYKQGSALALPFAENSFDVVWTEHVQMNIESKRQFYGEIARVLKPGGKFLFHDIFRQGDEPPAYPMPWADDPSISFLTSPEYASAIIESSRLRIVQWEDTTLKALEWFEQRSAMAKQASGPLLTPLILMTGDARLKMENLRHCLGDNRICTIQGVAEKLPFA